MTGSKKTTTFQKRKNNYQSNVITRSKQQFTLQEQKVVAFVINQIDHMEQVEQGKDIVFEIPIAEFVSYLDYKDIKKISKTLSEKKIILLEDDEKEEFDYVIPFPRVSYKNRILTIKMLSDVVPYFIELGKEYTKYHLETFLALDSVYSQRLYQTLMMYIGRKQQQFTLNVEKLQNMLNCNYPNFKDFRRRVLDVAQKEIKEKINLAFSYAPSKKVGKKITELKFSIKTDIEISLDAVEAEAKDFQQHTPQERNLYIRNLFLIYKFPKKLQDAIIDNPEALAHFLQLESEIENGVRKNIKNRSAYMATAMREFLKISNN